MFKTFAYDIVTGEPPMRECDVKEALNRSIRLMHAHEADTRILPEMVLGRGSSRIDLAVVNGKLHGYEIKSDSDTLYRLEAQAEAYNAVFDEITIVVGSRHFVEVEKSVPNWWGILRAESCGERVELFKIRQPMANPQQSIQAIASLLWKEEAIHLLQQHASVRGIGCKNRNALSVEISDRLDLRIVAKYTREALKSRVRWRVDEQQR